MGFELAPPSLQSDYTLCWSGDPALDLSAIPAIDRATASADEIAIAERLLTERDQKLKVARERGDWPGITKPNQRPVVFRFSPIGGSAVRWWSGESARRQLTPIEDVELMFRLALREVSNLPGFDLTFETNGKFQLVSVRSMDAIYGAANRRGVSIIVELGTLVVEREVGGIGPLF